MKFAALHLLEKTNSNGSYVVAAWHHPKAINWKWVLTWQWSWKAFLRHWNGGNGNGHTILSIPLVGWFHLSWQTAYWRREEREGEGG